MKIWRKRCFRKINGRDKKFEPSIVLAGRICSKSLTNLILQEDNLNEFAYAQVLLFYKDSFEQMRKDSKEKLFFEQNVATAHISSSNKKW